MSYTNDNFSFPVPTLFKKAIISLLLPGERLEDILDQVGGYTSPGFVLKKGMWDSKTMAIEKKKPKTLDMFFSKIHKQESDDSEDDSSSSTYSKLTKGCKPLETLSNNVNKKKTTEKSAVENKGSLPSQGNSPGHSNINSPIYSQDIFAEDSISLQKEYHSSPEKSMSPKAVEHSDSDDEIIPSSQAFSDSNRLSLGSLSNSIESEITQKSNQMSNEGKEVYKLPKDPVGKKSFLSSSKRQTLSPRTDSSLSEDEYIKQPSFSDRKKSMKRINELFSKINPDKETLSHSDITEDDEVYVMQCPSEIDLKQLKGLKLSLLGDSIISLGNQGNNKYDCFSVKETSKRNIYVALPDCDKKEMKIGTIPLAGNIILCENLNIPKNKPIKDFSQDEQKLSVSDVTIKDISKKKKKKHSTCEDYSTQDEHEFAVPDETNDTSKKKKRKRSSYEDYSTQNELNESSVSDVTINDSPKKKKKRHRSYEDSTQDELNELSVSDVIINDSPKKKKKKHRSYEDSTQDELNESSISGVTIIDSSKKKKKKHRSYEDSTQDELNESLVSDVTINDSSKKKKKKHRSYEDSTQDELNESSVSDVTINDSSKKKKKKHRSYEDLTQYESEMSVADVMINDVSKKEHISYEDMIQDKKEGRECFSKSAMEDVMNKVISKKEKRKKKTQGNNEINSSTTDLGMFLNIKTEWEEPQVDSRYPETPSKNKKRKRDIEDSVVKTEEEIILKKEKKNHSHSGSHHTLSPSQED